MRTENNMEIMDHYKYKAMDNFARAVVAATYVSKCDECEGAAFRYISKYCIRVFSNPQMFWLHSISNDAKLVNFTEMYTSREFLPIFHCSQY